MRPSNSRTKADIPRQVPNSPRASDSSRRPEHGSVWRTVTRVISLIACSAPSIGPFGLSGETGTLRRLRVGVADGQLRSSGLVAMRELVYRGSGSLVKARVTFRDPHIELEVPIGITLLEAAKMAGAPLGTHCGGVGACASCHVRIEHGEDNLSKAGEAEEDGLDRVFDVRPSSRLGCQARIESPGDIVVRITEESIEAWLREHPHKSGT